MFNRVLFTCLGVRESCVLFADIINLLFNCMKNNCNIIIEYVMITSALTSNSGTMARRNLCFSRLQLHYPNTSLLPRESWTEDLRVADSQADNTVALKLTSTLNQGLKLP